MRRIRACRGVRGGWVRSGVEGALGHDEITPGGGWREHAVVGELMSAWWWNQCREPLDEGERVE